MVVGQYRRRSTARGQVSLVTTLTVVPYVTIVRLETTFLNVSSPSQVLPVLLRRRPDRHRYTSRRCPVPAMSNRRQTIRETGIKRRYGAMCSREVMTEKIKLKYIGVLLMMVEDY